MYLFKNKIDNKTEKKGNNTCHKIYKKRFYKTIRLKDSDCSILSRRCFNLIFNECTNVSSS